MASASCSSSTTASSTWRAAAASAGVVHRVAGDEIAHALALAGVPAGERACAQRRERERALGAECDAERVAQRIRLQRGLLERDRALEQPERLAARIAGSSAPMRSAVARATTSRWRSKR